MTDKEFKRLSRAQLIDIIYQLQLQIDKLSEQKQALEIELADKRLRLSNAGNIADAALEINNCFRSAQNAAEQYLNEIKVMRDDAQAQCRQLLADAQAQRQQILTDAQTQRQQILSEVQAEAKAILARTQKEKSAYETAIEAILQDYNKNHSDNG